MNEAVENIPDKNIPPASYAWIIDTDLLFDPSSTALDQDEAGTIGPHNASEQNLALLKAGKGTPFRMLDDDGELYYLGRVVLDDNSSNGDFGPLWDFGTPNAGCTEIQYENDEGNWIGL